VPKPRPAFGHGTRASVAAHPDGPGPGLDVFGCYHVSQRNTFTGRLTPAMLRQVLEAAARTAGLLPTGVSPGAPPPSR
jgi:uracil-DNA glycosylase